MVRTSSLPLSRRTVTLYVVEVVSAGLLYSGYITEVVVSNSVGGRGTKGRRTSVRGVSIPLLEVLDWAGAIVNFFRGILCLSDNVV